MDGRKMHACSLSLITKENLNLEFIDNVLEVLLSEGCTYNHYYHCGYFFIDDKNHKSNIIVDEEEIGDEDGEKFRKAINFFKENYTKSITTCLYLEFKFFEEGDGYIDFSIRNLPDYIEMSLGVDAVYYSDEMGVKRFERLLEVIKKIYSLNSFIYGYYADEDYAVEGSLVKYPESKVFLNYKIKNILPVNFFSKKMVEEFGKQKLLSLDVHRIEELSSGDILLIVCPNPYYCRREIPSIEKQLGLR
jgi:hypothetical protein